MSAMNWEAVAAVAEVIGVVAVVVSLIYVGVQVRQNTQQLRHENLRRTVRGTLDTNWLYHREEGALDVFRRGVASFDRLTPEDQALFHSIVVDLAFYFEVIRQMAGTGLVDESALEVNERFLGGVLVTPGGREWLAFAMDSKPMPQAALDYLQSIVDRRGDELRPITDLQPWLAPQSRRPG